MAKQDEFIADPFEEEDQSEEQLAAREEEKRLAMVQALGNALLEKRKEAMDARKATGIEQDWQEDEEFYQSIDTANPEGETNVGKPVSHEGGPIGIQANTATRSSVFVPLTRPYVDAAHARIADMLLPNDDMPWSLTATPIAETPMMGEMPPMACGMRPMAMEQPMAASMPPPQAPEMGMQGPMPEQPAMNEAQAVMAQPAAVAANPAEKSAQDKAAEEATKQITDWLIECQYHAEFRKMLENAAKLGTGILKGPVPVVRISQKMTQGPQGMVMERVETVAPASFSVDPRNFFPDPACGEDVQRGAYVWEYDTLSARAVQDLLKDPSYIESQLRKVLKEGPAKQGDAPADSPQVRNTERSLLGSSFGIWYFTGMVDKETLCACGVPEEEIAGMEAESIPAIVTMINDTVVKATQTPMDAGGFPYDVMPWQRRAGMIWGMGVARQMRTPQRMVNAATRAMMDNGGFTSGPIWAIREKWIRPIDGKNTLTPRKGFYMTADAPEGAKIGDAISFTNIQAAQAELQAIITLGMKMAEDATGLPMLMQGQQGAAPDTVGGMQILNNNGSTVLRRIARQADDCVTERQIRRYYYWLLENSDNDAAKGDFQIDARGSTALVDRQLSNQALIQLAPLLRQDPDIHQGRLNIELLKAHRIDAKNLLKTDAEKAEDAKKPMPPPLPVMVAQIREKGATERTQMTLAAKAQEGDKDRQLQEGELRAEYEMGLGELDLASRELAQKYGINADTLKTRLAEKTMTLQTQVALDTNNKAAQVATAAAEPAGRAQDGHAFTQ